MARPFSWAKNARFIAITGWGQEADRERTRDAGFERHLVKPVDPQVLLRVIGEAVVATTQPG